MEECLNNIHVQEAFKKTSAITLDFLMFCIAFKGNTEELVFIELSKRRIYESVHTQV